MIFKKDIKLFILLLAIGFSESYAQQLPLYSQYMMNGFLFNPAVAGSDGYTTYALSTRDHMVGFDNSPRTNAVSFQSRLLRRNVRVKSSGLFGNRSVSKRSGRVGLGGYVFSDRNGYTNRVGGQIAYAYHIYFTNRQLSFGLSASTFQFKLDYNNLEFRDAELYNENYANKVLIPDANTGIYLLSTNSYYGFSVANCFETRVRVGGSDMDYRMFRHYFLMGGHQFNKDEQFAWEPSFLIKGTEKGGFQSDVQMRVYYNKDYYMGICYRTGAAIGTMVGAKINRFYFSYAFDYSLNSIRRYSLGSHELNVALKFGENARRYRWLIRY